VTLVFSGALGGGATEAARYGLTVNGTAVPVQSVQVTSGQTTVVLQLEALTAGDALQLSYDLLDAKGRALSGQAKVKAF
jgi:hypothetical protein